VRMVWLALFCPAALAVLMALRPVLLGLSTVNLAPVTIAADVEDGSEPLAKGIDRLPVFSILA
jgi:hypothetical protein